tara:strand:- start:158 stop:355 length:198 start_codon:yes stop_codon:yes gene_type:complete
MMITVKKASGAYIILLRLMNRVLMWQIGVGFFFDFLISGIPGKETTSVTKISENPFAPLKLRFCS